MPKTSGHLDPATYPPGILSMLVRTKNATTWDNGTTTWDLDRTKFDAGRIGASRVAFNNTPQMGDSAAHTANLERAIAYGTKWRALTGWKKARWIVCARLRHMNGRALYIQCSYAQNVPPEKQPISPCSRRATDPNASPFDWTP